MGGRLWIREAPGNIRELDLEETLIRKSGDRGAGLVIGRDAEADIVLGDVAVSRFHARLVPNDEGWKLIDLDSSNKTFVNGDPVKESQLRVGDYIGIGDCELHVLAQIQRASEESSHTEVLTRIRPDAAVRASGSSTSTDVVTTETPAASVLAALHLLSREIPTAEGQDSILEAGVRALVQGLEADRGAVLILEGEDLICRAAHSSQGQALRGFVLSQTIFREVFQSREAILSRDTTDDERFSDRASVIGEEIRSVLAAPLRVGDGIAGILYLDRLEGARPAFTAEHLYGAAVAAEMLGASAQASTRVDDLVSEKENLVKTIIDTNPIIGTSPAIQRVRDFIARAAPTDSTVLIQGETGTGKELVASAIHYQSRRKGSPFVTLNCAAIPETLVESELFGHERGAFTGAVGRKKGKFEAADQGTVFLDEVGELPLACQSKLLRLLEERCFERVGGTESISVDVRIVAATNRNLAEEVEKGEFREDLFYRLNVLQVNVPPLRERVGDLELLLEHFLDFFSRKTGATRKNLAASTRNLLLTNPWPGNVRQLRNTIECAVVMSSGENIEPRDLPPAATPHSRARSSDAEWEPRSIQDVEREHIERVLDHVTWNKSKAAELLGIERSTLYARIKNYELKPPEERS